MSKNTTIVFERYDEGVTKPPYTTHRIGKVVKLDCHINDMFSDDQYGEKRADYLRQLASDHGFSMKFYSIGDSNTLCVNCR